ncbi:hypothetical protein LINSTU_52 [Mycobacterium phage LinStu]|uniref:Uncharacterized protein n=1 Tax=Mycobacterium phage LinStu TaxID=1074307 RepID=G1JXE9_9CAUD|nr:hypothetical protein LINSTU_52 [Mycobacterium phage LinStu]AEL98294.1 hypothetical protein LINSTU_52 [Mycobacterium phage LinStu]AVR77565.1 hypothetical protein SEA_INTERFOLIA_59 [Mycobacterium phage InterFolia]
MAKITELSDTTVYHAAEVALKQYRRLVEGSPNSSPTLWEGYRVSAEEWTALALERLRAAKDGGTIDLPTEEA